MSDAVELSAGDATLRIDPRGAEPVSWTVGGRELLWPGGEAWPRTSPVLFPIVGRARDGAIRVDGRPYPMGIHGFAADRDFTVESSDATSAVFALADDETTRGHYPFAFRLEITYRLAPRSVSAAFAVTNAGEAEMPFALGIHPGFAWPFADDDPERYRIVFDRAVEASVPVISPRGLFTDDRRPVPLEGRVLPLSHALLSREALCFLDAGSGTVRLAAPGGAAIAVETENFPHVALWTRPPAPYLCIESWTGHGDPDDFAGELKDKPSMRLLAPGATSHHTVEWRFEEETA